MPKHRIVYWKSPRTFVVDTGTHYKDGWVDKPSIHGWAMWVLHRFILRKRDPFFYREEYEDG